MRGDSAGSELAFREALAQEESGAVFEGLGRALYLNGDFAGSIEAHMRAYAAYQEQGDVLPSARAARLLAWLHINVYGDFAVSGGWLARAEAQLATAETSGAEQGWIELMRACREPYGADREERLRRALETSQGDADLRFAVLAGLGEAVAMTGRVEEGMACFDEALAAACGGEISDLYVVESVFCGMFEACERVHDVTRAEQWLRAAGDLVRQRRMLALGPLCRAHYGAVLTAAGRWQEAEFELDEAARLFQDGYVAAQAIVLVRLADLRLQQGRIEEAAGLLTGLDMVPDAARPIAALHLARGDLALARDVLERRVARPVFAVPWPIGTTQPPPAPVESGLLAMLVDVHLAADELEQARDVTTRMIELATNERQPYLEGCAALAEGKVRAASKEADAAASLRRAMDAFARAQMPTEVARARLGAGQGDRCRPARGCAGRSKARTGRVRGAGRHSRCRLGSGAAAIAWRIPAYRPAAQDPAHPA